MGNQATFTIVAATMSSMTAPLLESTQRTRSSCLWSKANTRIP